MGTQKNHHIETDLLSTHNIYFGQEIFTRKIIFNFTPLSRGHDPLYQQSRLDFHCLHSLWFLRYFCIEMNKLLGHGRSLSNHFIVIFFNEMQEGGNQTRHRCYKAFFILN